MDIQMGNAPPGNAILFKLLLGQIEPDLPSVSYGQANCRTELKSAHKLNILLSQYKTRDRV